MMCITRVNGVWWACVGVSLNVFIMQALMPAPTQRMFCGCLYIWAVYVRTVMHSDKFTITQTYTYSKSYKKKTFKNIQTYKHTHEHIVYLLAVVSVVDLTETHAAILLQLVRHLVYIGF